MAYISTFHHANGGWIMRILIKDVKIYNGCEQGFYGGMMIADGKIERVLKAAELAAVNTENVQVISGEGKNLFPGLMDIHIHGSYGYDFIRDPQTAIDYVAKGLVQEGTTSFLASLTVVSHQELCSLLDGYAHVNQPADSAHFLGVHSEGPYLSEDYKALMDERYLRDPSITECAEMQEAANGRLKVMTIAPEKNHTKELIAAFPDITFMIGHTAATCEEALNAVAHGAKGFTHLYNAMSQHTHRSPGCVTAAFLADHAYCELIADGFHVDPYVLQATWKILGDKRIILITDAMLAKGMADGDYVFANAQCRKRGNTVQVKSTGRISGSAITMLDAIRNMRKYCNCTLEDLVQMACVNPAVIAGVENTKGTLETGKDADFILLDDDLQLISTFVMGKEVYHH